MSIAEHFTDILNKFPDATLLKEGGQKAVFLINHLTYGRCVLKVGTYPQQSSLERIQREIKTLKEINSPYYPKIYEFSIIDPQRFIIFEEYEECKPLSSLLEKYQEQEMAIRLLKELVNGLVILWGMQIVHRDLKPDNILITKSGQVKIIDLGIARLLEEDSLTLTFAISGPATPVYAAPEQLQNRKSTIDIRTDQFNLGIILVQLVLGGIHPFDPRAVGGGTDIVENILSNNWCRKLLVSADLLQVSKIAEKLLGREPYLRFKTPKLLMDALDNYLEDLNNAD